MSIKAFTLAGLFIGTTTTMFLDRNNFAILYRGLYLPHKRFHILKKNKFKQDMALHEDDIYNYIRDVIYSFSNTCYMVLIGKKREFLTMKQQYCFDMIKTFEFVKETFENKDYITSRLHQYQMQQRMNLENSYERMKKEEEEARQRNKSGEDYFLDNIKDIGHMSDDQLEKLKIEHSVEKKEDYLKKLPYEFKVENEANKLRMAMAYHNSKTEWNNMKRESLDMLIKDNRSKLDEEVSKNFSYNPNKILKEELKDKSNEDNDKKIHKSQLGRMFTDYEINKIKDANDEDLISRFKD